MTSAARLLRTPERRQANHGEVLAHRDARPCSRGETRAPPANAISPEVGHELHEAFCRSQDDPELCVAILTGQGRFFSAGWDLKEMAQTDPGEANNAVMNDPGGFAGITEPWDLHKPFISTDNSSPSAAVRDGAGGRHRSLRGHGGILPAGVQRGCVGDAGAIQRLPRKFPYNVAVELLLTGRRMGARRRPCAGLRACSAPGTRADDQARERWPTARRLPCGPCSRCSRLSTTCR
jgi:crotonobetainyl-CoA hydratase